jgi:hypothetical protein
MKKKYRLSESMLRRLIAEEVGKLTRFGSDPEEFSQDDNLHAEDVDDLVQPVLDKLFEVYNSLSELTQLIDTLDNGASNKTSELSLNNVDDDLLDDIDDVREFAQNAINKIEDIMGNNFANYMDDNDLDSYSRSDERFGKAGVEYHSKRNY